MLDASGGEGSVVAEKGTHEELMMISDGIYKTLVEAQKIHGVEEVSVALKLAKSMASNIVEKVSISEQRLSRLQSKKSATFSTDQYKAVNSKLSIHI